MNRKCYGYVWIRVIFQNDKSYVRATDLEFEITDLFYNELLLSSLLPVKASFEKNVTVKGKSEAFKISAFKDASALQI